MRGMDREALASKMRALQSWIDSGESSATCVRQQFSRPPFGFAEVTVDPRSTEPAASYNRNRIVLCGSSGGLTLDGLHEMIGLFHSREVDRFFVWLSPGPNLDLIRGWFRTLGFVKVPWTRYPTLLHNGRSASPVRGNLTVREVDSDEVASARARIGEAMMEGYAESAGRNGFHHYMAFDSGRPIAVAALVRFEDIGYLTYAGTAEPDRRRGAQSALIAHRVEQALAFGCVHIVSQTLSMLADSLNNLQRAGFREVYEQEVFEHLRR